MGVKNYKVYTPFKYANEITNLGLRNYFKKDYSLEKLKNIKIIDLSSGTGNLLCVALEKLIKLSKKISGEYLYFDSWITAYDLDEVALLEYEENIRVILKRYKLEGRIITKNCDSLTEDINKRYNLVLGNPPYLGEKSNKSIFDNIKTSSFGRKYYEGKMDYFYFFIEKGVDILEDEGSLVYIITNYWLKADGAKILRKKLKEEGRFNYINNINASVFEEAPGQHNLIFSWIKTPEDIDCEVRDWNLSEEELHRNINTMEMIEERFFVRNNYLYTEGENIVLISSETRKIIEKIKKESNFLLKDLVNINQGIISGADKAFILKEPIEEFREYLRPFYKNKDVLKYKSKEENDFWIFYLNKETEVSEKLKKYLEPYKEKLENRREAKLGRINWWELQWGREAKIFEEEKILARQRCKINLFSYADQPFYGSADIYYLTKQSSETSLYYILGYLNSKTFFKWYRYMGKSKGYNLEFYSTPLKEVAIYYPDDEKEILYIENLVKEQIKSYSKEIQAKIDEYFMKIYNS